MRDRTLAPAVYEEEEEGFYTFHCCRTACTAVEVYASALTENKRVLSAQALPV